MKKVKKILGVIGLIGVMVTSSISCYAVGEGNMSGGGSSNAGRGTSQNKWRDGDDGVRISIVDNTTKQLVAKPIDFTNKDRSDIKYDFGKVSKLEYKRGASLNLQQNNYRFTVVDIKMPTIVSDRGNNIQAIKRYFTSEWATKRISDKTGVAYDELISGKYKLLIEPIMYVTFRGQRFAMTAHETALYNQKINNGVRSKLRSISHQSLPFSLYLEVSDLGFPKYTGKTNFSPRDPLIINELGLGIVRFKDTPPDGDTPPPPTDLDVDKDEYEYRTDTDVITSFTLKNSSKDIGNDKPITANFHILGRTYTVSNIVIPKNSSQLVWVKWHTPKTPQIVNINVTLTNSNISSVGIKANIKELKEITPPDPKPRDRNDNFRLPNLPQKANKTYAEWSKWNCKWIPVMEWVIYYYDLEGNPIGGYEDHGHWEYWTTKYSAGLNANIDVIPSLRTPTWKKNGNEYMMKSGYGLHTNVNTSVSSNCPSSDITSAQNVITTFSEFKYNKYNRILEKTSNSGFDSKFEFKKNKYSTYNDRTHFTPIWYPDKMNHIVNAEIIDMWTPKGMLSINLNDRIYIDGNLHQDRHISIMK